MLSEKAPYRAQNTPQWILRSVTVLFHRPAEINLHVGALCSHDEGMLTPTLWGGLFVILGGFTVIYIYVGFC